MGFNLNDYEKWANDYKKNGGEPCIKKYLENKIKTISSQEANNQRWDKTTTMIKIKI